MITINKKSMVLVFLSSGLLFLLLNYALFHTVVGLEHFEEDYQALVMQAFLGGAAVTFLFYLILLNVNKNIKRIISQLEVSADKGQSYSKNILQNIEQADDSSRQIMGSVEDVVKVTDKSASSAHEMQAMLQELLDQAQSLKEQIKQVTAVMEEFNNTSNQTHSNLQNLLEAVDKTAESNQFTADKIRNLDEKSQKISDIMAIISNIAKQTKLLALNAAIEAERAGEKGQGFAVVAEEGKMLAEEVRLSTENINTMSEEIRSQTADTAQNVELSLSMFMDNVKEVRETEKYFVELVKNAQMINQTVTEVNKFIEMQLDKTSESAEVIKALVSASEDSAANMQEINASTEHHHNLMSKIRDTTKQLQEMTDNQVEVIANLSGSKKKVTINRKQKKIIEETKKKLLQLTEKVEMKSGDINKKRNLIGDLQRKNKQLELVFFCGIEEKTILCSGNGEAEGMDVSFRPYFLEAAAGNTHVSDTYYSQLTHNACVAIAVPVYYDHKVVGVLAADVAI